MNAKFDCLQFAEAIAETNVDHSWDEEDALGSVIRSRMASDPDRPAMLVAGLQPLSRAQLQVLIDEGRADLRRAGLGKNARIIVALPTPSYAALAVVIVACSAVAIPLNPSLPQIEFEKCLTTLRPDAIVVFEDAQSAAAQVAERNGLPVIQAIPAGDGRFGLRLAVPSVGPNLSLEEPEGDAPAFLLQTSGTTGESKIIPFSHRNMLAAAKRLQRWFHLSEQDRCLSVSPVYYSHGLKVTVFAPLLTGGSVAFPADAHHFDAAEWFGAFEPTWYSASPTVHRLVYDNVKGGVVSRNSHSLRFILSGGAPLSRDVQSDLESASTFPWSSITDPARPRRSPPIFRRREWRRRAPVESPGPAH